MGNGYLLDKMMTTSFPSCAILMQVADVCRRRKISLGLRWMRRDLNTEADALTNLDFSLFDPAREVPTDLTELGLEVMMRMLDRGETLYKEIREAKDASRKANLQDHGTRRKRVKVKKLRVRAPWNADFMEEAFKDPGGH